MPKTSWPRALLLLCLASCRAVTPPPSPQVAVAPVVPSEPPPPRPAPPPPQTFDLPRDDDSLDELTTELLIDGGVGVNDAQVFPARYSQHDGVFTFRGGPHRTGGAFGLIPRNPTTLSVAWTVRTGESKAPWFGGAGWTGQPVIVRWPAVVRRSMPKLGAWREKDGFIEVIAGSLDGSVHFIDLMTGARTRPALRIGNPIKGSVSLDPRGYPLLFVGQGIPERPPIGLTVFELIGHRQVFFLPGADQGAPRRGWGAFDSSGLLNRQTDTYVVGGENGLLYALKLNTRFDPLALTLEVAPEVTRYRYRSAQRSSFGIENSLTVHRNMAFFADNGGTLQAVDLRSMTPRWKFEAGDDTDATLVFDEEPEGPRLYTGTEVDKTGPQGLSVLRKLDAATGTPVWERRYPCHGARAPKKTDAGVFATPTLGFGEVEDLVFFVVASCPTPEEGLLLALDRRSGAEVWRFHLPRYSWSTPTLLTDEDGRAWLLHGALGGTVRLLEARTGRQVTSLQLAGDIEGSPAVFEGRAVIGTRANRFYGIDITAQ